MGNSFTQTMRLDELVDEMREHPDFFRTGANLSADKKSVINPEDIWEIAFIATIPDRKMLEIGSCFLYKSLKHYNDSQDVWLEKEKSFLREQLGRAPTSDELLDDAKKNQNFERYRLCYVLNFPKMMVLNMGNYRRYESSLCWFLAEAQNLHPKRYPYFEEICANSGFTGQWVE